MTSSSNDRCFQIAELDRLRSARHSGNEKINEIWPINGDEFYALAGYVAAFTRISLNGYRQTDTREAFEACARTLDALEKIVTRMNNSVELMNLAARARDDRAFSRAPDEVDAVWKDVFSDVSSP